jgi:hypothetical protein
LAQIFKNLPVDKTVKYIQILKILFVYEIYFGSELDLKFRLKNILSLWSWGQDMLTKAEGLLQIFYESFPKLYGRGSCGLNVHIIGTHLCEFVKLWGPLWCWSCFPFEDINAMLLNAVHGTGILLKQAMKYRQAQLCIRRKGLQLKISEGWKITCVTSNCDIAGAMQPLHPQNLEDSVRAYLGDLLKECTLENKLKKISRIVVN